MAQKSDTAGTAAAVPHLPLSSSGSEAAGGYYPTVAQAFDRIALDYDDLHDRNPIIAWLRAESLALLKATFPLGARLLELGCGAGWEALRLAQEGYQVLATDLSPGMIEIATREQDDGRPRPAGRVTHSAVDFRVLAAHQVDELLQESGPGSFEGAYSSFGALNCEPQLDRVVRGLNALLVPGGRVVVSVLNAWCPWEQAWYLLHGKPAAAFRRLRGPWPSARLAAETIAVRYFTPRSLARAFAPHFTPERTQALGVLVPPPYLNRLAERFCLAFQASKAGEARLRGRWPFYWFGDHVVMVLRREEV